MPAQPGSIGDGWYSSYLGNYGYWNGNWYYDWNSYNSYYWGDYGQYDYGWGYDGFAGAYGGLSLDPKFYAVVEPELLRTVARAVGSGLFNPSPARGGGIEIFA